MKQVMSPGQKWLTVLTWENYQSIFLIRITNP